MRKKPIRVLIADDHFLVRRGLKNILGSDPAIRVVSEVDNGTEVVNKTSETSPDVIVLDISMPGKNGLDVLKELHRLYPNLPVLMLSIHSESRFAGPAYRAGAAAYLKKERAAEELLETVHKLAETA